MALSQKKIDRIKIDYEAKKLSIKNILDKYSIGRTNLNNLAKAGHWKRRYTKNTPKKPKKGRPSEYRPEYAKQVQALCLVGYGNTKLAEFLGISKQTFYRWLREHSDFSDGLTNGRVKATTKVAISMHQRATGYSHPETKFFCYKGMIVKEETIKHYPPDVSAGSFILKNREPEHWKDKQEIETTNRTLKTTVPANPKAKDLNEFQKMVKEEIE